MPDPSGPESSVPIGTQGLKRDSLSCQITRPAEESITNQKTVQAEQTYIFKAEMAREIFGRIRLYLTNKRDLHKKQFSL